MRYTFKITDTISVVACVKNKRTRQLVSGENDNNGVMPTWVYNSYDIPPTAAWTVDISNPVFSADLGDEEYDESIDVFAWRTVRDNGGAENAIIVEWPDGRIELSLPEHNDSGTDGVPTTVDELREMVIQNRINVAFGDGMERDYAESGLISLGQPVNGMTREDLELELDGIIPEISYDTNLANARMHLTAAVRCLLDAEKRQSEMVDISGPGSREWEILTDRIKRTLDDLDLVLDQPGALEERIDGL